MDWNKIPNFYPKITNRWARFLPCKDGLVYMVNLIIETSIVDHPNQWTIIKL